MRVSFSCAPLLLNILSGWRIFLFPGGPLQFAWNVAWGHGYSPPSFLHRDRRVPAGPVPGRTSVEFLRSAARPDRTRWTPYSRFERAIRALSLIRALSTLLDAMAARSGRTRWGQTQVERSGFPRREIFWPQNGRAPPSHTPNIAIWSNYGAPLQLLAPGSVARLLS